MTHWSATDGGILTLPSGRTVRGRGLSTQPQPTPEPDFGLYLLAAPLDSRPAWEHTWVEWTDFGLPVDPSAAREALTTAWQRAAHERVEVACLGGLGRTGTALACLAVLDGLSADSAIDLVRTRYDVRAIETPEQAGFVNDFAIAQPEGTPGASHDRVTGEPTPRVVRVGGYAVCIHGRAILLVHQISEGPAHDKWTLPGGGADFGEAPADAAVRECREETGLTPMISSTLGVHSSTVDAFGTHWHSVRILFEATFAGARPTPVSPDDGEIDQVAWFALDNLPAPITEWAILGAESVVGDVSR